MEPRAATAPPPVPAPAPGPPSWPLMRNNVTRADLDALIEHLQKDEPSLTQAAEVRAFEREWSDWLGVRYSVFVNSGSSANLLTMAALRHLRGGGEVIVPPLTWVSDIAAVLQNGFEPVFVDIEAKGWHIDPEALDEALTQYEGRVAGVLSCATFGTAPTRDQRAAWRAACERHGVPLLAAAVQFPLRHPAVKTVLVGVRSPAELDEAVDASALPVPDELWDELG